MAGSQYIHPLGCESLIRVFHIPKTLAGYHTEFSEYVPLYNYDKIKSPNVAMIKKRYVQVGEGGFKKKDAPDLNSHLELVEDPNNYNKARIPGPGGFWSVTDYNLESETLLCVQVTVKNLINGCVQKAKAIKYLFFDTSNPFITMNIHLPKDDRLPLDTVHISGKFKTLGKTNLEYMGIGPVAWDNRTRLYDNFLVEKGLLSFNTMQSSEYIQQNETILTIDENKRNNWASQYDVSGLI